MRNYLTGVKEITKSYFVVKCSKISTDPKSTCLSLTGLQKYMPDYQAR